MLINIDNKKISFHQFLIKKKCVAFFAKFVVFVTIISIDSPVPNIQWLFINGSMIASSSKYVIKQYGRELLIRNVTFDDDGVYRCVADGNLTNNPYLNVTGK